MHQIFDNAQILIDGGLVLTSGLYCVLQTQVGGIPPIGATQRSQLTEPGVAGYAPQPVTSTFTSNNLVITQNPTFQADTANVIGVTICKQQGASPAATDPPLFFSTLRLSDNSAGFPVLITPNGLRVIFPTTAIYSFGGTTATDFQMPAPPTSILLNQQGFIWVIGSNNSGATWANPITTKINGIYTGGGLAAITNRNADIISLPANGVFGFDFFGAAGTRNCLARPTHVGILFSVAGSGNVNFEIATSNALVGGFTATTIADTPQWTINTSTGAITSPQTNQNQFVALISPQFTRYLRVKNIGTLAANVQEIDFFGGFYRSPTLAI